MGVDRQVSLQLILSLTYMMMTVRDILDDIYRSQFAHSPTYTLKLLDEKGGVMAGVKRGFEEKEIRINGPRISLEDGKSWTENNF